MYILECSDGSYYTGSTIDLERRLQEHQNGEEANHTKKRLPVTLVCLREPQATARNFLWWLRQFEYLSVRSSA
ncbi:GIY-YIG nuclease family protein [Flavobacterium hankyongi]